MQDSRLGGGGEQQKLAEEACPLRASCPGARDPGGLGLPATSGLCCACRAAGTQEAVMELTGFA